MTIERVGTIPTLPKRPADSHKGRFGTVLVLAGGRGMAGAAALCGTAALRSGAGLVRVVSAAEVQPTVAGFEPSYMTYPVPNDANGLMQFDAARQALERFLPSASVLAVGPGLGQSSDLSLLIRWILGSVETPVVLDADGLNAVAGHPELLASRKGPLIITPHPGEFARLTGTTVAEVQADREGRAVALATTSDQLVVVLKGTGTVVTDGRRLHVNGTGNPGMATGGVGDVLTGVTAALVAQKLPPFDAAVLGTHVHGLAGDLARDRKGEVGLIAGDLVDVLADAFVNLPA